LKTIEQKLPKPKNCQKTGYNHRGWEGAKELRNQYREVKHKE